MLFLIPLRRYFVREMHGQLPYPEATAITEVLVTGEKGGSQAKLLLQATAIAGVYDFFVTTFQVWKEFVDFQFVPVMKALNDKAKMVVQLRRDRLHSRARVRDGTAQFDDPVRRRRAFELRAGAADLATSGSHVAGNVVYPGTMPIARHDGGADLPELRAVHRRRSDRDGGHLRNPEIAEGRGGIVRRSR